MIGSAMAEVKAISQREGRPSVSAIVCSPSIKPDGWLVIGLTVECPECKCSIQKLSIIVSSDSKDQLIEAMTLWPDAIVESKEALW